MFTSSSIDHNTSIMTANAKAHSVFLPQGLELVSMTQFQSNYAPSPFPWRLHYNRDRANGDYAAPGFTKEEDRDKKEAYTKEASSCSSQPIQPN